MNVVESESVVRDQMGIFYHVHLAALFCDLRALVF